MVSLILTLMGNSRDPVRKQYLKQRRSIGTRGDRTTLSSLSLLSDNWFVGGRFTEAKRSEILNLNMTTRILKWLWFLVIAVILIEKFRVNYYYRIWNHADALILVAALADAYPERFKGIVDAKGADPEWLSGELMFSIRSQAKAVRMTNVFRGPSNEVFTEVGYSSTNRFWNTDPWEVAARYSFNSRLMRNPEFAEILSTLQDEPAARRSKRLYTGASSVTFILDGVDEAVQSIQREEMDLKKRLADSAKDPDLLEWERQFAEEGIASRKLSIASMIGSLRQAFHELYGEGGIPEATVQRLMAVGTRAAD